MYQRYNINTYVINTCIHVYNGHDIHRCVNDLSDNTLDYSHRVIYPRISKWLILLIKHIYIYLSAVTYKFFSWHSHYLLVLAFFSEETSSPKSVNI